MRRSSEGVACAEAEGRGGDGQGAAEGEHVAEGERDEAVLHASAPKYRWRWKRPAVFREA